MIEESNIQLYQGRALPFRTELENRMGLNASLQYNVFSLRVIVEEN